MPEREMHTDIIKAYSQECLTAARNRVEDSNTSGGQDFEMEYSEAGDDSPPTASLKIWENGSPVKRHATISVTPGHLVVERGVQLFGLTPASVATEIRKSALGAEMVTNLFQGSLSPQEGLDIIIPKEVVSSVVNDIRGASRRKSA